jgi:hypothetical protein
VTLTITPTVDFSLPPRVRLDVAAGISGPLPVPAGAPISVVRVHADGSRWQVILENNARLGSGTWAGFDYHAPFNQSVTYIAQAAGFESAASAIREIPNDSTTWLIHSSDPTLSFTPELVTKLGDLEYESDAQVFNVYNSPFPVTVSSGTRKAASSSIEFMVLRQDIGTVQALFADSGPILLNTPSVDGWDLTWVWIQPGNVKISNPSPSSNMGPARHPLRTVSFPFQLIGAPEIDTTPIWTCDDVVATYATCNAVVAAYSTCTNLALDVRS